jgi:hypothetical protein
VPGRPKWGDRAVVIPLLEYVFGPCGRHSGRSGLRSRCCS